MVQIPRWQYIFALVVVLLGLVYVSPNFFSRSTMEEMPGWLPQEQVNLGLDLRGGSYLLLQVDVDSVFQEQLEGIVDVVRSELRRGRVGYTGLGRSGNSVVFTLTDPGQTGQARDLLRPYLNDATLRIDDTGAGTISLSDAAMAERRTRVLQQSIEIIRRRIDETGTREPSIQRQGEDRVLVQLPGVDDPERVKELIGRTAKLSFHLTDESVLPGSDAIPAGSEVLEGDQVAPNGQPVRYVVRKRVLLSGDNLVDAQPTFQQGAPVVSFRLDSIGAARFADVTRSNVGRPFAIVLDDKVISAPVIREPILGGSGVISGSFTVQQAQDLALLLRAGALPAALKGLEERSVGPGLGEDSIRAGETASVIGFVAVIVFMCAAYGLFGIFASAALLLNLVILMGAMSALQATLTLPGIAGIVLTIGMAVDANVLIFERMREEVRQGRGPVSAIDVGYRKALSAIVDSNLTTLIAGLLLFNFGSGPIKGFAVTLSLGIITSMFTAIMLTRIMVVFWLRQRRPQALPI